MILINKKRKKVFFSIITVTKNSHLTLERCIKSVSRQTFKDYEHIIIDGASNKKTLDIIQKNYKSIAYSITEPDKNLWEAINKGIKASKGEIICILNSDDIFFKDALKLANKYFKKKKISYLFGSVLKNKIYGYFYPEKIYYKFNIFPSQIGRDFAGTVEEFYRDNPVLKKRALQKLKDYGVIRKRVTDAFELGKRGRQGAAFQFDHPISFAALQRSGDIEGAIRTNPIMGDVNQWKLGLDRKLNNLQQAIIKGNDVDANIAKVEKLKNINQTLFGDLAGDFTIDKTGKINVIDYGAPKILDPQYDIAKAAAKNVPLGGFIKKTLASGKLTPELTEVFGEKSATNLINRSQKLIEFAKTSNKLSEGKKRIVIEAKIL